MTWLFVPLASAPASEGSTSESASLDPTRAASLSWRGKPQQPQAWSRAWKRGGFIRLLSGLTSEPSTLEHGVAQWIASCRAIPVRGTPSPESASAPTTTDGCSTAPSRSLTKAGLTPSSARTSRGTYTGNSPSQSRHWSDWGAALRQEYSARLRPVPVIDASASSSSPSGAAGAPDAAVEGASVLSSPAASAPSVATAWPSPRTSDTNGPGMHGDGGMDLRTAASMWQTPAAQQFEAADLNRMLERQAECKATGKSGNGFGLTLANEVQIWARGQWATPQARDHFPAHSNDYIAEKKAQGHGMRNLNDEAAHWSTPKASDGEKGGPNMRGSKGDQPLPSQAAHWPTPMAGSAGTDTYNAAGNSDFSRKAMELAAGIRAHAMTDLSLPDRPTPSGPKSSETRRRLNPLFVEWLMGWPEGLSGFDTAATASCHSPQPSPGCDCMDCWLTRQREALSALLTITPPAQGSLL